MIKLPPEDGVFRKRGDKVIDWGKEEWNIMKPHIQNFRTCLDIGAHVGITSIRFSSFFKEVHSFEPVLCEYLIENTKHLTNVKCYNYAISDKDSVANIYPGTHNSGASIIPDAYNTHLINRRYTDDDARYKEVKMIKVPTKTIDSFNFKDVDLVKIDVEGHIVPVLEGMLHLLEENSPVIQLETAFSEFVNETARNIVTSLGYIKFNSYGKPMDEFYKKDEK
ncbi:hypothetical protein LCGC14_0759200 [marine sediment metagenome]|uniref:Methyltransferase FkbM domain-containing protein n=1 Tax=marine sediment metagenome TaxID=412755 RepID=A0A0F9T8W5_9ZZZZ